MPSWIVDLLLVEAGVFLVSMAGCFLYGMYTAARDLKREQERERQVIEIAGMTNFDLYQQHLYCLTFGERYYYLDLLEDELRKRRKADEDEARGHITSDGVTTARGLGVSPATTTNEIRMLRHQIANMNAQINRGFSEDMVYADNTAYFSLQEPYADSHYSLKRLREATDRLRESTSRLRDTTDGLRDATYRLKEQNDGMLETM